MGTATQAGPVNDGAPPIGSPEAERPLTKAALAVVDEGAQRSALVVKQEAGAVALTAQVEARIKAQYFLARNYPRNWMDVQSKLLDAFKRPVLAEGALYSKPIGTGTVEGLSIRFAEEAFRAMGNIAIETTLVSDDDDKRVYSVIGMDMETNASLPVTVVVTKQVERSTVKADSIILGKRTNSRGKLVYMLKATSEDDYRSKEMAQLQKARRDVIIFFIPGDVQEACEAQIRATVAKRDKEDPQAAINRVAALFHAVGVTVAEIEKYLGHPIRTMNNAELAILRAIHTGIKDGEGTWADLIDQKLATNTGADVASSKGATEGLRAAVKEKGVAQPVVKEGTVCSLCGGAHGTHDPDCRHYSD